MNSKTAKDELYETALNDFGVKLDRRQKLSDLEEQVRVMKDTKSNPKAEPVAKERKPKTVKHIVTGNTFCWQPFHKGNADLEVIEWETEDGDN